MDVAVIHNTSCWSLFTTLNTDHNREHVSKSKPGRESANELYAQASTEEVDTFLLRPQSQQPARIVHLHSCVDTLALAALNALLQQQHNVVLTT